VVRCTQGEGGLSQEQVPYAKPNPVAEHPAGAQLTHLHGSALAKKSAKFIADPHLCKHLHIFIGVDVRVQVEKIVSLGTAPTGQGVLAVGRQCIPRKEGSCEPIKPDFAVLAVLLGPS
jgi:hypothetical protein